MPVLVERSGVWVSSLIKPVRGSYRTAYGEWVISLAGAYGVKRRLRMEPWVFWLWRVGTKEEKSNATAFQAKENGQFCQILQDQNMTKTQHIRVQRDLKGLIASPEKTWICPKSFWEHQRMITVSPDWKSHAYPFVSCCLLFSKYRFTVSMSYNVMLVSTRDHDASLFFSYFLLNYNWHTTLY